MGVKILTDSEVQELFQSLLNLILRTPENQQNILIIECN
jgi:hypothetical protein